MPSSTRARNFSANARRSPQKARLRTLAFDVKSFLDSAGLGRNVRKFRGKETVYLQGDSAESVMYIQEGGVKLSVVNEIGKEAVVAILGPADFLGEGCLAGQEFRMGTTTAIVPTTVLVVEKNEMMRVLHAEHELSDRFMSYILTRNIRIEEDLIDQLFNSSEKRLARDSFAAGALWQRIGTAKGAPQSFPGAAGGDGGHHALASQFFHEQIQETGIH